MEELEIVRILNKYNPWWSNREISPFKFSDFKRGDYYIIKSNLAKREITSIIGPRRVGKTVLIHQLISSLLQEGVPPQRILYLSIDEVELKRGGAELKDLMSAYSKFILKKPLEDLENTAYVFLDEIRELPDWEKILKNWHNLGLNLKFVISGSSSIWISKGTEESLLGRISMSVMLPLKFSETLRFKKILPEDFFKVKRRLREALVSSLQTSGPKILFSALTQVAGDWAGKKNEIEIHLNRYLTVGGYPEFLEENDYQRISEAIRDKIKLIFFKDIVRYFRIRNPSVLEDLFKILAKESGFSFNVANTARVLGIERPTLKEYLKYLTKAYLIESAEFYSESRRKRLRKQEKIYVLDPGIRNGIVDYLDDTLVSNPQELGKVVEGLVFDHLKRLKYNIEPGPLPQIFYWKNQKEIDFILQIKRKAIPVEVKYRAAIPSSAISTINEFLDMHKCPLGIIISKEELSMNQKVITIPLWLFLLMA